MTRVYLMADFGKGPRVVDIRNRDMAENEQGDTRHDYTARNEKSLESAAWWLVEAESADAARAIIRECADSGDVKRLGTLAGEILASGGAK